MPSCRWTHGEGEVLEYDIELEKYYDNKKSVHYKVVNRGTCAAWVKDPSKKEEDWGAVSYSEACNLFRRLKENLQKRVQLKKRNARPPIEITIPEELTEEEELDLNQDPNIPVLSDHEFENKKFTIFGTAHNPLFAAREIGRVLELANITSILTDGKYWWDTHKIKGYVPGVKSQLFLTKQGLFLLMYSRVKLNTKFHKFIVDLLSSSPFVGTECNIPCPSVVSDPEVLKLQARNTEAQVKKRKLELYQLVLESISKI